MNKRLTKRIEEVEKKREEINKIWVNNKKRHLKSGVLNN